METTITSNPMPPTGVIPTEVPLGITTITTDTPLQKNFIEPKLDPYSYDYGIYLTTININTTQLTGTKIFTFKTDFPLELNSNYTLIGRVDSDHYVFTVPWSLITAFYSRLSKIEWEINFKPIKVGDCRVSLDGIFTYEDSSPASTLNDINSLAHDTVHKILDDTDDNWSVKIPMHFVTNYVPTYSGIDSAGSNVYHPPFLPGTTFDLFIRNPYQPSLLQPERFQIVVTLRPIVTNTIGIASTSLALSRYGSDSWVPPVPHFFRTTR